MAAMLIEQMRSRLIGEIRNLYPLFRYLILQTETHAFCLALAAAALLGFFPACAVMLTVLKDVLHWPAAYAVMIDTIRIYFPTSQIFVIRNLEVVVSGFGQSRFLSLLWVLVGAAGVFIPLETGFNRLWQVKEDRPYWLNQIVGFTLTVACAALSLVFVAISTSLHLAIAYLPFDIVQRAARFLVIRGTITALFITTIFALYKFLPNRTIAARQVFPAAIVAGIMAELVRIVFSLVIPFVDLAATQGPFSVSVTFLMLVYFETFVVLGGAFIATRTDRYSWMGFFTPNATKSPD